MTTIKLTTDVGLGLDATIALLYMLYNAGITPKWKKDMIGQVILYWTHCNYLTAQSSSQDTEISTWRVEKTTDIDK